MVGHELFRGENKPYRLGIGGAGIWGGWVRGEEIFGSRVGVILLSFGTDVLQKCSGCFESLLDVNRIL